MTKEKKNYEYFTLILDKEVKDDVKIFDWMKANRTRKLKYADMLREAMLDYIDKKEGK